MSDAKMDAAAAADFLRRLSVADAKVLLERTRKEKENKTLEMQKMIGVRYRDLIESADKIVNMHSAALRLEVSLKDMPDQWRRVDAVLKVALSPAEATAPPPPAQRIEAQEIQPNVAGVDCDAVVVFLVDAPEKMWVLLDSGKSFQAFLLLKQAKEAFALLDPSVVDSQFPFIRTQWSGIESFQSRLSAYAKNFLACRGKESQFYAENLCALASTDATAAIAERTLDIFLDARSRWMHGFEGEGDELPHQSQQRRVLTTILKTLGLTMLHAEAIFVGQNGSPLMQPVFGELPGFQEELEKLVSSGRYQQIISDWFQAEMSKVQSTAFPVISRISSISLLSQVQTQLTGIDKSFQGCCGVSTWRAIVESIPAKERNHSDTVFSVVFADAFRRRTRDLVQSSFTNALEAVKAQIRSIADVSNDPNSQSELQMSGVAFYDYFERIHKNTSALDASDLQSVLIEEFMRTLLKLVLFFEREFPVHRDHKALTQDPVNRSRLFLTMSNILAGILAGFPSRVDKLFSGASAEISILTNDASVHVVRSVFDLHSENGYLTSHSLQRLVKESIPDMTHAPGAFIDEDVNGVSLFGFHSFLLISGIRKGASYPHLFVQVFQSLSRVYCEEWAQILLQQKIHPLRELLEMEDYGATNEEWIATHEGWSEHIITDEVLGGGDDTDDSSDVDMRLGEEKVWLPWCETPVVSSFLFSCCYGLDEANRVIRRSLKSNEQQATLMHQTIRDVLIEQLTLITTKLYDDAISLLISAKSVQSSAPLNFGECCVQQFLFDMYFVRATLGFSDFVRFGWGDELDTEECNSGLVHLKKLFARMQEFIDPVDWEIYGPQLIENVVLQFRKSRLLFSSLSESNDINEINGKAIVISAQDNRPLAHIMEPVARFSLLPVPSSRRKYHRSSSMMSRSSEDEFSETRVRANSRNLFHELSEDSGAEGQSSALRFQNLLSGSAGSNLLSAATSGTNLLSSAAKGIGFLSSATSSYLRDGETRSSRYF